MSLLLCSSPAISFAFANAAAAYGSTYHYHYHYHHHHRHCCSSFALKKVFLGLTVTALCSPLLVAPLSPRSRCLTSLALFCRPSSGPITGNSLFSRMEGIFHRAIVWVYCLIVIISTGRYCAFLDDDIQPHPSPVSFSKGSWPLAISNATVLTLDKQFWSGRGITKSKAMVEQLQHYGIIKSMKVAEVMQKIDRALFVPEGSPAYLDSPMPIGYNATISAPHMHATCLQLLEENLQPGMHALDVGSGTGYLTACFALMVGPQGRAVGVEHIPELVDGSIVNIQKSAAAQLFKEGALSMHVGDGRLGWPDLAPYDAIHVGAAAPEIPKALIEQLKPGGRMVIPVGNIFQDLKVVQKNPDGSISVRDETSVRYVPLTSRDSQLRGF